MKKILSIVLVLGLIFSLASCGTGGSNSSAELKTGWKTVEGDGFSFNIPETWTEKTVSGIKVYMKDDNTNVNVVTSTAIPNLTSLTKETLQQMVELTQQGYTCESVEKVTLDGAEGIKSIGKVSVSGVEANNVQYMVNKGTKSYIITYTSAGSATDQTEATEIANSFRTK